MELSEIIQRLTEEYHEKLRHYSRTEGKYTEYPTSDRLKEMNIIWGHCIGLKQAIDLLKAHNAQATLL